MSKKGSMYVKLNKQFTFKDFTSNFEAKGWNYYVCFHAYSVSAVGAIGNVAFNCISYIKDA